MPSTQTSSPFDGMSPMQKQVACAVAAEKLRETRDTVIPQVRALELELERRAYRSFKRFVEKFWSVVEPKETLVWNWHLDALCKIVEDSRQASVDRVVNVPPGTMKSLLFSVLARAWLWSQDPTLRFLAASYGGHLSVRDNVRLRTVVSSPNYQRFWPGVKLTDDQNAKTRFETTAGGWSVATSVGGPGTGEHPDYIIIDDPLTAQQALSAAERQSAIDWIDQTISPRGVTRNVRLWLIMQRLHEQDPTGHVLEKGTAVHTCFPMKFEPDRADPLDQRVRKGELLWPSLFDESKVRKLEITLGQYGTAGQLQQRPSPEGGGLFKREWFSVVESRPVHIRRRVRGWDIASTEGGGDYTVGVLISEDVHGTFFVEDVVRGQWGPAGVDRTIYQTAELDGRSVPVREEQEGGSSGKAVSFSRAKLLAGWDYAGIRVSGKKPTRANPFRSQCQAGNVKLVRGDWNHEYLQELCSFPTASHDDQVDGTSCAFNELIQVAVANVTPFGVGSGRSYWNGL